MLRQFILTDRGTSFKWNKLSRKYLCDFKLPVELKRLVNNQLAANYFDDRFKKKKKKVYECFDSSLQNVSVVEL